MKCIKDDEKNISIVYLFSFLKIFRTTIIIDNKKMFRYFLYECY